METNVLDERLRFIGDYESSQWSMSELCERYDVTRPTGYKWLARFREGGRAGLVDRSRAPHECPHRTSDATEALIVEAREEYGWGAKKLLRILRNRQPTRSWPARSTVNDVLDRHKLLHKNRRRRTWTHPGDSERSMNAAYTSRARSNIAPRDSAHRHVRTYGFCRSRGRPERAHRSLENPRRGFPTAPTGPRQPCDR
jgi:transposase-like protein